MAAIVFTNLWRRPARTIFTSSGIDHLDEGRTGPVSEKEAGPSASKDGDDRVRRLIEALLTA
ncbi:MAG TPA: hypothetical protein VL979_08120 [Solirubrobacteraceae bacterium]|nr:hypothetical protein [Solirubrobacteraceae bacterium]